MADQVRVLVVDDDEECIGTLCKQLKTEGFTTGRATDGVAALGLFSRESFDVVITDVGMPKLDGFGLLKAIGGRAPVIMLTGNPSTGDAVKAIQCGAADYLEKPWPREEMVRVLQKVLQASQTTREQSPRAPVVLTASGLVGVSRAMEDLRDEISRIGPRARKTLLQGESGTGKELAARALHAASPHKNGPFIAVNCGGMTTEVFIGEIFGTTRGVFTDALDRPGKIEAAEGGTLFLDEIGELKGGESNQQSALLRFLEDFSFSRMGSTQTRVANVRIIAATNRPLERMVEEGAFRGDLFQRLSVTIRLPPLRERPEDIPGLAQHFLELLGRELDRPGVSLTDAALARLQTEQWKGNARELRNFIEGLLIFTDGTTLDLPDVERVLARRSGPPPALVPSSGPPSPLAVAVEAAERSAITAALHYSKGRRDVAARILEVSLRTLFNKLKQYGIE